MIETLKKIQVTVSVHYDNYGVFRIKIGALIKKCYETGSFGQV